MSLRRLGLLLFPLSFLVPACTMDWGALEPVEGTGGNGGAGAAGTSGGSGGAGGESGSSGAGTGGAGGAAGAAGASGASGASGKGGSPGTAGAGGSGGATAGAGGSVAGAGGGAGTGGAGAGGDAGSGGAAGDAGAAGAGGDAGAAGAGGDAGAGGAGGDAGAAGAGGDAGAAGSGGGCPSPAKSIDGGCYFLLEDTTRNHDASNVRCGVVVAGGTLATFPSKATQDLVLGAAGLAPTGADYWFALDCAAKDASCNTQSAAKWTWLGGAPTAYTDWAEIPADSSGCARINQLGAGAWGWRDRACTQKYFAVCQVNLLPGSRVSA